ncbi:MAG TPA: dethiobiotin synthase [Myxococcota bacterium]|nr:dethiobiotin synthase [Myxococcota bacterium]
MALDVFVTGTDTGVGKTVVSASLAALWRVQGRQPRALKPVASGVEGVGEDEALLGVGAGHEPCSYYRLKAPLSPHRAARIEGVTIDRERLNAWVRAQPGPRIVEGVGGWEVPLGDFRVSDWAVDLGFPVLVVAPNRLGVLNQSLLTVEAVRRRGLRVVGLVLVSQQQPDGSAVGNLEDLRDLLPGTSVREFPFLAGLEQPFLEEGGRHLAGFLEEDRWL